MAGDDSGRDGVAPTPNRRAMLKKMGVGAAAAWTAPVVLSGVAKAAGTIGPPPPTPCVVCRQGVPAVVNGNADNGTNGWTVDVPSLDVFAYNAPFPAPSVAAAPNYFRLRSLAISTGPGQALSASVHQDIGGLLRRCEGLSVNFAGYWWVNALNGVVTSLTATLEFRDVANVLISSLSQTFTTSNLHMAPFSIPGVIPVGTRNLRVVFTSNRTSAAANERATARFDDVSVTCV